MNRNIKKQMWKNPYNNSDKKQYNNKHCGISKENEKLCGAFRVVSGICRKACRQVVFWLFPYRCPICEDILGTSVPAVCGKCRAKIAYIREPVCIKCGKSLTFGKDREKCQDCTDKKHLFTEGRALFEYRDAAAAIYRFKYGNKREYAAAFAREIYENLGMQITGWQAEALVPVPLHRKKQRKRGYNQAKLLAEELGRLTGIPVCGDWVARCRNTVPQKELNASARQNNLKRAFKITRNDVKLSTIIIIDDIYTTGQTVDEISGLLLENGVRKIYVLTLAIGTGL